MHFKTQTYSKLILLKELWQKVQSDNNLYKMALWLLTNSWSLWGSQKYLSQRTMENYHVISHVLHLSCRLPWFQCEADETDMWCWNSSAVWLDCVGYKWQCMQYNLSFIIHLLQLCWSIWRIKRAMSSPIDIDTPLTLCNNTACKFLHVID